VKAAKIAWVLGGARRCGRWWRCVCPVHGSRTGRSLTLALCDHPRGLALHCHAGCSRDEILAELHRFGLFVDGTEWRPASVSLHDDSSDDTARRAAAARRLWQRGQDARGSPVERYLRSRGIPRHPRRFRCAGRPPVAIPAVEPCRPCWRASMRKMSS
jgi:putative DNA primase/helicase